MEYQRLAQGQLAVTLHPKLPAVDAYRVAGGSLRADPHPVEPTCLVYSPARGCNLTAAEAGLSWRCAVHGHDAGVSYEISLEREERPVIGFILDFRMEHSGLRLGLGQVHEAEGFQLVHVELPRLLSACASDPGSRLVLPTHGGRRIDPARCSTGERTHRYNWVRDAFCQVGIAYAPGVAAVLELESLNDWLLSSVYALGSDACASFGVRMVYRMEAQEPGLQFPVHRPSAVRLVLLATDQNDTAAGWVPAARWLHAQRRNPNPDRYAERFIYKVFVGKPGSPSEVSFDAALAGVRRRFHLFDGAGQVCYLVGFQHQGHDTGYPDVFTVNEAAGGAATASPYNFEPKRPFGFTRIMMSMMTNAMAFDQEPET